MITQLLTWLYNDFHWQVNKIDMVIDRMNDMIKITSYLDGYSWLMVDNGI